MQPLIWLKYGSIEPHGNYFAIGVIRFGHFYWRYENILNDLKSIGWDRQF